MNTVEPSARTEKAGEKATDTTKISTETNGNEMTEIRANEIGQIKIDSTETEATETTKTGQTENELIGAKVNAMLELGSNSAITFRKERVNLVRIASFPMIGEIMIGKVRPELRIAETKTAKTALLRADKTVLMAVKGHAVVLTATTLTPHLAMELMVFGTRARDTTRSNLLVTRMATKIIVAIAVMNTVTTATSATIPAPIMNATNIATAGAVTVTESMTTSRVTIDSVLPE
mmetsp:Transcript_50726/g.99385  ORF Transcript_50726/g.99385 Transcript_50726/m.99385 type:complete len:233 (-) Transcript_50726:152-850(-)